jgi:hypothetical protein
MGPIVTTASPTGIVSTPTDQVAGPS